VINSGFESDFLMNCGEQWFYSPKAGTIKRQQQGLLTHETQGKT
jgi:hypothetical protein